MLVVVVVVADTGASGGIVVASWLVAGNHKEGGGVCTCFLAHFPLPCLHAACTLPQSPLPPPLPCTLSTKTHTAPNPKGEHIGDGTPPAVDIAVDPLDGTTLTAQGRSGAISVSILCLLLVFLYCAGLFVCLLSWLAGGDGVWSISCLGARQGSRADLSAQLGKPHRGLR